MKNRQSQGTIQKIIFFVLSLTILERTWRNIFEYFREFES